MIVSRSSSTGRTGFLMVVLAAVAPWAGAEPLAGSSPSPARSVAAEDLRPPAVAGAFYPADRKELSDLLDALLSKAVKRSYPKPIRALIVPHAGYVFSAECAAKAFKQLEGTDFDRVVLIGCPHRVPVEGTALWAKGGFETPLGRVLVDEEAARAMMRAGRRISDSREPHVPEHSLEVEIPFLQKVLKPGFSIVPALFHPGGPDDLRAFEAALRSVCDSRTVIVVSTDLSHYPGAKDAEEVDGKTLEAWKKLDAGAVAAVSKEQMARGVPQLACTQCGEEAVLGLFASAKAVGIDEIDIVGYANSAAASKDSHRVVGYGAAVLTGSLPPPSLARSPTPGQPAMPKKPAAVPAPPFSTEPPDEVGPQSAKRLLAIAREAVRCASLGKSPPKLQETAADLNVKRGCFVTLHLEGKLRGCIGCFGSDDPLYLTVQRYAIASSTEDSRFQPVTPAEAAKVDVEISVLSGLSPCPDWKKIELGKHGVIVRKGPHSGVFLPQVATETGWALEEFLGHLAQDKAGLGRDGWRDPDARLFTFTVLILR